MSDQISATFDNQTGINDGAHTAAALRMLSEQSGQYALNVEHKDQLAAESSAMVGTVLPDVAIAGTDTTSPLIQPDPKYVSDEDGSFEHFVGDCLSVLNIVKDGAVKEFQEHPVDLLVTGLEGIAIGAVGLALAPEVAAIALGAGIGYGIAEVIKHMDGWMHDADVVTSPEDYTDTEIAAAHQDLEGVGAGGAHLLAGTLGGFTAKPLMIAGEGLIGTLVRPPGGFPLPVIATAAGVNADVLYAAEKAAMTPDATESTPDTTESTP